MSSAVCLGPPVVVLPVRPCPPWGAEGAPDTPPGSLPASCSLEQSSDELVAEVLSSLLKQLPLAVEKDEGTGAQGTFRSIVSGPMWESLCKGHKGRCGAEPLALGSTSWARDAGFGRRGQTGREMHRSQEAESPWTAKPLLSRSWKVKSEEEKDNAGLFCFCGALEVEWVMAQG